MKSWSILSFSLSVLFMILGVCPWMVLSVPKAFSSSIPELQRMIQNEVIAVDEEVTQCTSPDHHRGQGTLRESTQIEVPQDKMFYRNLMIRVQASVGFVIPFVADVYIVPEVELLFQKPIPEGWQPYYP